MKKIIALLLCLLPIQAFAITGVPDSRHWEYTSFGGAGTFSMVVPDHFVANKIYAIPDVNAPYVTTNNMTSWTFLSYRSGLDSNFGPTQTAAFIQSKNDANLMFAMDSSNQGFYRSLDAGQTWVKFGAYRANKGDRMIAIDPTDDNNVYVGSVANGALEGGRVYYSTDKGATFSTLFRPFDTAVTGENAEINGTGSTRTGRLNNLNNILKGSVVFTSTSGETFTDNGSGVLVSNMGGSGTITYSNISSGNYGKYSLTFGSTPSSTTVDYTVSFNPSFVYVTSDGSTLLVGRGAASGTTLVKYDIGTDTITPITLTGTNATYNGYFDTYLDDSSVENVCVAAGHKLACSSDLSSWTYTTAITTGTTTRIYRFAVSKSTGNPVKFVAHRSLITNAYSTVTVYSLDGGTTWNTVTFNKDTSINPTGIYSVGTPRMYSFAFDPFDNTKVYASSDWRTYYSTNSGATFNEKDAGASMSVSHDVAVTKSGRIYLASMDTGLQHSDNGGVNWTQDIPNATQGYVTGSLTDYGGHYWQIETAGTQQQWENGQGKIWVCATMYSTPTSLNYVNYVIRSLDSGATWTRSNSGLPTTALGGDALWSNNNGTGGYCRAMGLSADETTLYVAMDGQNTAAGQYGGLFKSTDDGSTFTRVWTTPNRIFNALAVDPTDATNQILMFGTFSYNLYRKTGASTANYVGDGNGPLGDIVDVNYDVDGKPYAVGSHSGPVIWSSVNTSFGDGSGQYGTWRLMKQFGSSGLADGLVIDPQNKKRVFVSVAEGTPAARRIYVTKDANQDSDAKWYDITGDLPVVGGCRALTIDYHRGNKGYLLCASNGAGLWQLPLDDSSSSVQGRVVIGGKVLEQ